MGKKKKKAGRRLAISAVPIPNVLGRWSGRDADQQAQTVETETQNEPDGNEAVTPTETSPQPKVKTYGTARPTVTPNGQPTTLVAGERQEKVTPAPKAPKKDFRNPVPHRAKTIERSIDGSHRIKTAPLILLTLTAHRKSCSYIRLVPSGEIGWLGTVKELGDNRYLVTDCFLFEQEVQMFECDINGRKVADMAVDLIKAGRANLAGSIKFWAHLHPHGSTSPSGQDERMSREWGAGNEENVRFMIRAIYTCDGRAEFTFFDYIHGIQWKDCQWATYSEPSKKFDEQIQKEIDEKLKRPAPTYATETEYGGGYHGYHGQSAWGQGRTQRYDPVSKRWVVPGEGYVTRPAASPATPPTAPATTGVLIRGDETDRRRDRTGDGPIEVPVHGPDDEAEQAKPTKPRIRLTAALGHDKKEPDGLAAASGEPQDDAEADTEEPKTLTASIAERMMTQPERAEADTEPETETNSETEAEAEAEATEPEKVEGES